MEQTTVINMAILKTVLKETLREVLQEDKIGNAGENEKTIDAKQAAAFLNIKISTLYEKTSSRCIPHIKQGNRLYFYLDELKEWRRKGKIQTVDELSDEAVTHILRNQKQAT